MDVDAGICPLLFCRSCAAEGFDSWSAAASGRARARRVRPSPLVCKRLSTGAAPTSPSRESFQLGTPVLARGSRLLQAALVTQFCFTQHPCSSHAALCKTNLNHTSLAVSHSILQLPCLPQLYSRNSCQPGHIPQDAADTKTRCGFQDSRGNVPQHVADAGSMLVCQTLILSSAPC